MKWAKYWNRILRYIISVIILSGPENIEAWAGSIACIIIISWKILCERHAHIRYIVVSILNLTLAASSFV